MLVQVAGGLNTMREPTLLLTVILLFCGLPGPSVSSQGTIKHLLVSPRLAGLRKDVEAGNHSALERFWQDITKQGALLVERIHGDEAASRTEAHSATA